MRAAFRQLPPNVPIVPILRQLGEGERVDVTLSDGTRASMILTKAQSQPSLPLPVGPKPPLRPAHRLFIATYNLFLPLAAQIFCAASDRVHAEEVIERVLNGEAAADPHFQVIVDADQLNRLCAQLERLGLRGVAPPDTEGFRILDIVEQKLLGAAGPDSRPS
jgi:hypothetical protein